MNEKMSYAQMEETYLHARKTIEALHDSIANKNNEIESLKNEVNKWRDFVLGFDLHNEKYLGVIRSELYLNPRLFFNLTEKDKKELLCEQIRRHMRCMQQALFPHSF